jgi:serine/threonine protein kinase
MPDRDLKPENIMYDPNSGTLKIVDLGSAIDFNNSECAERKRVGTSYYIAP